MPIVSTPKNAGNSVPICRVHTSHGAVGSQDDRHVLHFSSLCQRSGTQAESLEEIQDHVYIYSISPAAPAADATSGHGLDESSLATNRSLFISVPQMSNVSNSLESLSCLTHGPACPWPTRQLNLRIRRRHKGALGRLATGPA